MALLFEEVGETSLDDSVITDVLPSIPDIRTLDDAIYSNSPSVIIDGVK